MNIYQRLSEITAEITAVAKNLSVGFGQSKYKAVGEADVLASVKPIEKKHGVYSYPASREIVEQGIYEKESKTGDITKQLYMRVKTRYRFVNVDEPSDYVEMDVFSDGVDTMDKAPGKAMTYGDKYALLKAYKIITGDDPDQYASEPIKAKKATSPADLFGTIYPPRSEVERAVLDRYKNDAENYTKALNWAGVKKLSDMPADKLITIYNRIGGK